VDFDPTNSLVGNRNLIRVAVAWDQRNALPLWGTFYGPPASFQRMDVDVSVTEENSMLRLAAGPQRASGLSTSEHRDFGEPRTVEGHRFPES
jgi:hypothetical protein